MDKKEELIREEIFYLNKNNIQNYVLKNENKLEKNYIIDFPKSEENNKNEKVLVLKKLFDEQEGKYFLYCLTSNYTFYKFKEGEWNELFSFSVNDLTKNYDDENNVYSYNVDDSEGDEDIDKDEDEELTFFLLDGPTIFVHDNQKIYIFTKNIYEDNFDLFQFNPLYLLSFDESKSKVIENEPFQILNATNLKVLIYFPNLKLIYFYYLGLPDNNNQSFIMNCSASYNAKLNIPKCFLQDSLFQIFQYNQYYYIFYQNDEEDDNKNFYPSINIDDDNDIIKKNYKNNFILQIFKKNGIVNNFINYNINENKKILKVFFFNNFKFFAVLFTINYVEEEEKEEEEEEEVKNRTELFFYSKKNLTQIKIFDKNSSNKNIENLVLINENNILIAFENSTKKILKVSSILEKMKKEKKKNIHDDEINVKIQDEKSKNQAIINDNLEKKILSNYKKIKNLQNLIKTKQKLLKKQKLILYKLQNKNDEIINNKKKESIEEKILKKKSIKIILKNFLPEIIQKEVNEREEKGININDDFYNIDEFNYFFSPNNYSLESNINFKFNSNTKEVFLFPFIINKNKFQNEKEYEVLYKYNKKFSSYQIKVNTLNDLKLILEKSNNYFYLGNLNLKEKEKYLGILKEKKHIDISKLKFQNSFFIYSTNSILSSNSENLFSPNLYKNIENIFIKILGFSIYKKDSYNEIKLYKIDVLNEIIFINLINSNDGNGVILNISSSNYEQQILLLKMLKSNIYGNDDKKQSIFFIQNIINDNNLNLLNQFLESLISEIQFLISNFNNEIDLNSNIFKKTDLDFCKMLKKL